MSATLQVKALVAHVARHALAVGLLIAGADHVPFALFGALNLYLAAFAFTHELAHGALGLPRRLNEWAVSLAALPMLISGHGMRLMHLRHHARPLAGDDVEGVGARLSLGRALLAGPVNAAQYRVEAFRAATTRERWWMGVETAVVALLIAVALFSQRTVAAAWVVVCLALQLTASAWASHLPHRPPAMLVRVARHLEWTRSAVVASFLHHEWHHRFPARPLAGL